jgi:hypothetical protein
MAQYIHYTFGNNSSGITNFGTGGAAHNGHARRNQYAKNSLGHPIWGPMTDNADVISVDGGLSNPYQHTWQIGLNIRRFWPVAGVDGSGVLCGNDGKLFSYANDQYYAYLHQEGTYPPLRESGIYHFSVELTGIGGYSNNSVQFYLGVGANRPVKIPSNTGTEGRVYWDFNYSLQLNTNYYFQISINLGGGVTGSDYYIGNCAPGCRDTMVVGFPAGCYFYSWREDNTVLDLNGGGNWKDDVPLWAGGAIPGGGGGTTPVKPVPKCPCKHIWCAIAGAPTTSLYKATVDVNKSSGIHGVQGWVTNAGGWIANKPDATAVSIVQRDPKGTLTTVGTIKPDAKGNFSGVIPSPKKAGVYHYNAKGSSGNWGNDLTITWGGILSLTSGGWEGSTPAACTPNTSELATLVRGTDNHVYLKQQQHGVWGVWKGIGGTAYSGAGVGAASWGGDRIDVFVTGTDNKVWHASNANGWAWQTLTGISTSSLGATSDATNEVTVFCRGSDGACWYKEWNGSVWGSWTSLGGQLLAESGPCACSLSTGRLDVFVTGTNGAVYHKYRAGGVWSSTWESLSAGGFQTTASPGAAAIPASTQLAVFAQGKDNGHLYMLEWNDGAWDAAWLELGGTLATGTGPGVCSDGTNYHVFVTGTNAQIYHAYGNGDVWYAWENLGGKDAIDATEPSPSPGGIIPTGTGGLPGGPTTTPPSPQDLTLVPITPVPTARPAGISVVLRDHKKAPPTGGN